MFWWVVPKKWLLFSHLSMMNPQLQILVNFCQFKIYKISSLLVLLIGVYKKTNFSRVYLDHVAHILSSDFQLSFSKIWCMKVKALNYHFWLFWGILNLAFVPCVKHKQELPQYLKHCDFMKDIKSIQLATCNQMSEK